jgi:hypothetical protein
MTSITEAIIPTAAFSNNDICHLCPPGAGAMDVNTWHRVRRTNTNINRILGVFAMSCARPVSGNYSYAGNT